MTVFYAFCRVVDDIADDASREVEEKRRELASWTDLVDGRRSPRAGLEESLRELLDRYPEIDRSLLVEIVRGMEMDLGKVRYDTYADLQLYCHRVASAVGLVSIRIFGCTEPAATSYATELGHALQLTNIIRDVGEDLREADRIYLPREDLERFGVTELGLRSGTPGPGFRELMRFEATRAKERFANAVRLYPRRDRKALRASELMRLLYQTLLAKMERDGFRVLDRRYRLKGWEKLFLLARGLVVG